MKTEAEFELSGELKNHLVRIEFDFQLARPAPPCSDPDSPRFSDPGDPGEVEILAAFVLRRLANNQIRARPMPADMIDRLRDDDKIADMLYNAAVDELPRE